MPPQSNDCDLTVVLVNYNTAHLLERLFAALDASRGTLNVQIIVVDNASRDGSAQILRTRFPGVELIANTTNVGFGRANNQALTQARGRHILLLNTDAFVSPDTLAKTVRYMDENPQCGVLGVKLVGPDGTLQPSCRYFPTAWNIFLTTTGLARLSPHTRLMDDMSWDHASVRDCDWVPGCFYLIRREAIEKVGLFDPRYFLYYEEIDHCRAVRGAGWRVVYYPFTTVMHIGGESAGSDAALTAAGRQISPLQVESELLYFRKHHGLLGVLNMVCLSILADMLVAGKGIIRRFNTTQATASMRHAWTIIMRLIKTRLATQATR
jgi:N-acetylglucosaminyl-diphospho-decaprenol L-rhamnosyltransferase